MAAAITERQRDVLMAIGRLTLERGFPPTVREVGSALGRSSPSTVQSHIDALIRRGYLASVPGSPRTLRVVRAPE